MQLAPTAQLSLVWLAPDYIARLWRTALRFRRSVSAYRAFVQLTEFRDAQSRFGHGPLSFALNYILF